MNKNRIKKYLKPILGKDDFTKGTNINKTNLVSKNPNLGPKSKIKIIKNVIIFIAQYPIYPKHFQ
jgi:hypothetical protein